MVNLLIFLYLILIDENYFKILIISLVKDYGFFVFKIDFIKKGKSFFFWIKIELILKR